MTACVYVHRLCICWNCAAQGRDCQETSACVTCNYCRSCCVAYGCGEGVTS